MYQTNHPLTSVHASQEALHSTTTAPEYSSTPPTDSVLPSQMPDQTEGASSGAFAETMRKMDEEFYRVFPAARAPVILSTLHWVYDRSTGQYLHTADPSYEFVRESNQPPSLSLSLNNDPHARSTSLHYDYSQSPAALQATTDVPQNASQFGAVAPSYDSQEAIVRAPHFDPLRDNSAVEEVPPHLIVPSQRPLFDFQPEIRRQQQWGSEVEMYNPYPHYTPTSPELEQYSNYPASPPMSDPLSPSSPRSPMTPTHTDHPSVMTDDWTRNAMAHSRSPSGYPTEFEDSAPNWSPYSSSLSNHRPIAPAPHNRPPSPASRHSHHSSPFGTNRGMHYAVNPHRHPSPPRSFHQIGVHYERSSSHRLRGTPGYTSRPRRSPSPTMEHHYCSTPYSSERGPSPVPLSPLADQKKPAEKKPPLACLFCRGRKIACGPPSPGSKDRTCNQCQRRSLKCEYPLESRRGMRKKKIAPSTDSGREDSATGSTVDSVTGAPSDSAKPSLDDTVESPGAMESGNPQPLVEEVKQESPAHQATT